MGGLTGATKAPEEKIKGKDAEVVNPLYESWMATDQQVLGYLLLAMTKEILVQVSACRTSAEVWSVLETTFSSVTKARVVNSQYKNRALQLEERRPIYHRICREDAGAWSGDVQRWQADRR